jgi:hypothetical protein
MKTEFEILAAVSEEYTASIFRAEGGIIVPMFLRNTGSYLHVHMALQPGTSTWM